MAPKAWDHRVVNPLNPYENFDSENDDDDQLQALTQDQVDKDNMISQKTETVENNEEDTISFSISQSEQQFNTNRMKAYSKLGKKKSQNRT